MRVNGKTNAASSHSAIRTSQAPPQQEFIPYDAPFGDLLKLDAQDRECVNSVLICLQNGNSSVITGLRADSRRVQRGNLFVSPIAGVQYKWRCLHCRCHPGRGRGCTNDETFDIRSRPTMRGFLILHLQ